MSSYDSITYKIFNNSISEKYKKGNDYFFIFTELEKTGLPINIRSNVETKDIYRRFQIRNFCSTALPIPLVFSFKKLGLVNKVFLSITSITVLLYNSRLSYNQNIVEALIKQDNQIGHEARILIKYKIPDHVQIPTIEMRIQDYKDNIKASTQLMLNQNKLLNKIILEEEESNALFEEKIKNKLKNK
jgi:hypothetical protein